MIAIFIRNFDGGGAEKVAVTHANFFQRQGYDVVILCLSENGPNRVDVDHKVRVICLKADRLRNAKKEISQQLSLLRPEIFISHMTQENIVCQRAATNVNQTHICFEHNSISEITNQGKLKAALTMAMLKRSYSRVSSLFVVSEGVGKEFSQLVSKTPVHVLYNPIDLKSPEKESTREHPAPYIIMVGRLTAQKNYQRAIRLFAEIEKQGYQGDLRIFGEGRLKEEIRGYADNLGLSNKVFLHGYSSSLQSTYFHADMLLLTSKWEGFGNVIVEAMQAGTKVAAVDCPHGPREILLNGEYGTLLPLNENTEEDGRSVIAEISKFSSCDALRRRGAEFFPETILQSFAKKLFDEGLLRQHGN